MGLLRSRKSFCSPLSCGGNISSLRPRHFPHAASLKQEVDGLNLSEMLREALAEGQNVDYREVSFILGRLS
jgi:hypothetical protein